MLILASATAGCAGYQIGAQSLYPPHIRTVYVPVFESTSFRRNLGERLTEAVIKQIERTTPYKVTGRSDADSVLWGMIVGETKRVTVSSLSGEPREVQTNLQILVSWIDRQGNVIRRTEPIPVPDEMVNVSGAAALVPEVGQSVTTAHQLAIDRLAEQIVSLMQCPW